MEINVEHNRYLILKFDRRVDYKLYENFEKIQSLEKLIFYIVYLDFSETKFVTLPGAVYIIFFLDHLRRKKQIETRIIDIDYSITSILSKYGFFNCAKLYGSLVLDQNIENINTKHLENLNIQDLSSLYWPIRTIPEKSGHHFESDESGFTNSFIEYFNMLNNRGKLDTYKDNLDIIKKGFVKAAYELGKNIWEHSQSWGLYAIQSADKTKTNLVICDNGVGFIGSFKLRNPGYSGSTKKNKELLEWLLIDGNSSKGEDKNGHGLTRVIDFIRVTNGILLIRTDQFEITVKGKQTIPEIKENTFFKGTQIFINF